MVETDINKFFQAFISQMIAIGGVNLPKSISSRLGWNLGDLYRKKGKDDVIKALKSMFVGMGGEPTLVDSDDERFTMDVEYPTTFCPIGGANPKRYNLFSESICKPYTSGFVSAYYPDMRIKVEIERCILKDDKNKCRLRVHIQK
ncbi:MAG: hypothetical protein ACTSWN_15260 [Promethearchaeota archaeon]